MSSVQKRRLPELTDAGLKATANVVSVNEYNQPVEGAIAVERALTIYLDKREIVTLMTLGNHPELLILGWLRNQRMIDDIEAIKAIQVDWETESVAIVTHDGIENLDDRSRDIIQARWLMDPKTTLQALADKYDVSAERIRQLEAAALKKLKARFDA